MYKFFTSIFFLFFLVIIFIRLCF